MDPHAPLPALHPARTAGPGPRTRRHRPSSGRSLRHCPSSIQSSRHVPSSGRSRRHVPSSGRSRRHDTPNQQPTLPPLQPPHASALPRSPPPPPSGPTISASSLWRFSINGALGSDDPIGRWSSRRAPCCRMPPPGDCRCRASHYPPLSTRAFRLLLVGLHRRSTNDVCRRQLRPFNYAAPGGSQLQRLLNPTVIVHLSPGTTASPSCTTADYYIQAKRWVDELQRQSRSFLPSISSHCFSLIPRNTLLLFCVTRNVC